MDNNYPLRADNPPNNPQPHPQPRRNRPPRYTVIRLTINRRVLKITVVIIGGFLLGVLLGLLSTTLIFTFMPEKMIENGLKDRKARLEAMVKGRPEHCVSGGGLVEHFNPATNTLDLCICLASGMLRKERGRYEACASLELQGYGELGI